MFERFSDGARRATALASEEARQLGHDFIGTEHLLLGLLALGEGVAFDALTELEVTVTEARAKVTERVHPVKMAASSSPPFTPLAKKSLERALRESVQLGDKHIGSEHLLLGLTDVPDGGGARVLVELTGALTGVRQAVLSRLPAHTGSSSRPIQASSPRAEPAIRYGGIKPSRTLRSRLWTARGEVPDVASVEAAGAAPRCPTCGASLADSARYQVLMVPAAEPEPNVPPEPDDLLQAKAEPEPESWHELEPDLPGQPAPAPAPVADPVAATVVYCGQCGNALGVA